MANKWLYTADNGMQIRWGVGEEHYRVARKVQATLQRYQELQDIIAILSMDELGEEDVYKRQIHGAYNFAERVSFYLKNETNH